MHFLRQLVFPMLLSFLGVSFLTPLIGYAFLGAPPSNLSPTGLPQAGSVPTDTITPDATTPTDKLPLLSSFGGTILSIIPCADGGLDVSIQNDFGSYFPPVESYIWLPTTIGFPPGLEPTHPSQYILGLADDVPYYCTNVIPILSTFAPVIQFVGTSFL